MFFCLVFVMPLCTSVYLYLVVTYGKRAGILALLCCVSLQVCHFPIGTSGQVCSLIASIPDLCTLTYFALTPSALIYLSQVKYKLKKQNIQDLR